MKVPMPYIQLHSRDLNIALIVQKKNRKLNNALYTEVEIIYRKKIISLFKWKYRYFNYKCAVYVVYNVQFPNAVYKYKLWWTVHVIFLIVCADFIASLNIGQHTKII